MHLLHTVIGCESKTLINKRAWRVIFNKGFHYSSGLGRLEHYIAGFQNLVSCLPRQHWDSTFHSGQVDCLPRRVWKFKSNETNL